MSALRCELTTETSNLGKFVGQNQMNQQLTWEKSGQDEDRFKRYLILALSRSGVCVMLQDDNGEYLFIANLFDFWSLKPDVPPIDVDLFGPEISERLAKLKKEVRQTGDVARIETKIGSDRFLQFIVEAVPSTENRVDLITTIVDLSEERRRETVLRNLLRELSHRSKNMLAIVQSVSAQTALHSKTIEQFLGKFRGRLYALSQSQDLVTASDWKGAHFKELLADQTDKFMPDVAHPIDVEGENPLLSANAATHLGLAFHELISNSVTHGFVDEKNAQISVQCDFVDAEGGRQIEVIWTEAYKGNEVQQSQTLNESISKHFGSVVLERVVPAALAGAANYHVATHEIYYRLIFPAEA